MTEFEANNVNIAVLYCQLYEDNQFYLQNSFIMHADPYNVPQEELIFLVRSDNIERSYYIRIYEDIVARWRLYEYVKEICNVDSDVSEMIVLGESSYELVQEIRESFKAMIRHYDEEICKNIANAV